MVGVGWRARWEGGWGEGGRGCGSLVLRGAVFTMFRIASLRDGTEEGLVSGSHTGG